jgi:tRNA threonylcarbamoyl adenosine modification protein YeaZ
VLVGVLDTATPAVTAAVVAVDHSGVRVEAERVVVDSRAHGERLAPGLAAALDQLGARPGDLGAIVAGLGPGPFTGLRVGLVTAAALGNVLRVPTYGVCSLDAIAAAVSSPRVLVAIDARRREVYWAFYADGQRVEGPAVGSPQDLGARFPGAVAVGDGALRYADVIGAPVLEQPRYPQTKELAAAAAARVLGGAPSEVLTPLYLRRPDAVAAAGRKSVLS